MQGTDCDIRGFKLHVRRAGRGEPLLFLHGAQGFLNGTAGDAPALDALAREFNVIAPDHPGFGLTGDSDVIDDIGDLAYFYLDVLDTLDLEGVHVVGHCIGGWTALEMAVRSTQRLKSLTLVGSAGIRVKGVPRADMFIHAEADLMKLLFSGRAADGWLKAWRATPEMEDQYDRNRMAAAKYSWSPRLCNPKLDRWLHRINIPTHIIWGADDRVIPKAYAEALKGLIPGATATTLPGCAHLPHVEQPKAFAGEVSQFIRRVAR